MNCNDNSFNRNHRTQRLCQVLCKWSVSQLVLLGICQWIVCRQDILHIHCTSPLIESVKHIKHKAALLLDTESGPWYRSLAFLAKQVGPFLIRFILLIRKDPRGFHQPTFGAENPGLKSNTAGNHAPKNPWGLTQFLKLTLMDSVNTITWPRPKSKGGADWALRTVDGRWQY